MRLDFDQKMNLSNLLYKQEQEAAETARRLGLENEYACHFARSYVQLKASAQLRADMYF